MNLTAQRLSGNQFTAEDLIGVTLDTDDTPLNSCVHTVVLVSGVDVTHGGGAPAGEYLHYKSIDEDADADGIIDYSTVEMSVVQAEKGTSIIKIKVELVTKADYDQSVIDYNNFIARAAAAADADEEFTESPPAGAEKTYLETGEITLNWSDDTPV